MVAKSEIYQGGISRLTGGISSTIKRKAKEYEETKQKEREEKEKRIRENLNIYSKKLEEGEIKNINQIPLEIRPYFNLKEIQEKTKKELVEKINEFSNRQKELEKKYEEKVNELRKWKDGKLKRVKDSEKRKSILETYSIEKNELRKDYKPEIDYYKTYASQLKRAINDIDKGDLISAEYALKLAENKAKYDKKTTEYNYRKELANLKSKIVNDYIEKINKGEMELKDVPSDFKKYIKVETKVTQDKVEQKTTPIYVDKYGNPVSVIPGFERDYETLEQYSERIKSPFLYDFLSYKVEPSPLAESFLKESNKEIRRYVDLGYKPTEAKILAEKSLERGGMTFSPDYAEKILTNYKISEQINKKNLEISKNVEELGKNLLKFIKKDNLSPTSSIQLSKENTQDLRSSLNSLNNLMNSIYDRISYGVSKKEAENYSKIINKIQQGLKTNEKYIRIGYGKYAAVDKEVLKDYQMKLEDLNKKLKLGLSSPTAKLSTIALDVSSDFIIPGKGVTDAVVFVNQLIPNEKDLLTVYKSIQNKGIKETIKQFPEVIKEKLNNFFTNAEQRKELNEWLEKNKKEIERMKKLIVEKKVDKTNTEAYIRNLENQNKEIEEYKKELNQNKLFTIGTIGYLALTAIGSMLARKITTKVSNNYDEILNEVKRLNSYRDTSIKKVPYVSSTFSDLKNSDVTTINKYLKIKKISPDDISSVRVTGSSEEFSGGYFVKRINKDIKLKSKGLFDKNTRMNYYTIGQKPSYWNNRINIDVRLKDGSLKSFSIISKSPKPIPNYNSISNILKYGTNKKIIVSSIGDSGIVKSVQFGSRAGKLKAEDYWLGKKIGKDTVEVRKKSKIIDDLIKNRNKIEDMTNAEVKKKFGMDKKTALNKIKENLTPESYWFYAEPEAVVKTKILKKQTTPIQKTIISDDSFFQYSRINEAGYRTIIRNDVNIDTGKFKFIMQNYLDNLNKLKKNKLSSSKKILLNIGEDIGEAYKKGKSNYLLSSNKLKSLSRKDLSLIYDSINAVSIPKNKFKIISKNASDFLRDIKKINTTLQKNLVSVSSKLNRISNSVVNSYWEGISNKQKEAFSNSLKQEKKQLNEFESKIKKSIKQNQEVLKNLVSVQEGITDTIQLSQLSLLTSQLSVQESNLKNINSLLNEYLTSIRTIENNLKRIKTKNIQNNIPFQPITIKKTIKEKDISPFERDFSLFVRKKGKDIKVSSAKTKKEAKKKLKSILDTTLRASGFIEANGKKVLFKDLGADFQISKKDPWRIVEKRSKRLSSKKEVSEIQKSKKSGKSKKIKTPEDYWLK